MSTVTIHVPEDKKEGLISLLRDIPYITIDPEQTMDSPANWRSLAGKYAQSGISTETLTLENEAEKVRAY